MRLYPIETGNFKLDGGAMFGVVPKTIWNKTNPANENNLIDIAARCLLIEDRNRLILIDTGMGNKQTEKFFGYYSLWGNHSIDKSLAKYGFSRDDITDVFMTHLHFDHCGGSVIWNKEKTGYEVAFKNAKFWTNENHWQWATKPNAREKASFLSENILPMQESGQLNFITKANSDFEMASELNFDIFYVDGHTEKMMIPHIKYQDKTIAFCADLIPTAGHLPLPYVMGYDTRPLLTMPEKLKFLTSAAENNYYLFLEHDAHNEIITVEKTEKGIRLKETFSCSEILT
ncbi:MBL fold metallo-hydrolase [Flavobacterium psychrophilum]|uniref:Metal-dependent hydrolase n=3 Tax=Flavobacterium psychrophilum TaxID=96345 RepID=A6H276_FLAPJ|nr:MBL fold metallo-hydrolase [Flavobacterium psychrophilum]AIG31120.1 beta-lactamase [Flavobacterium psychrophilum]AIG33397.1 beta-lactamase [Flavobacterium psychrophilum]AIG35547.1 beta-lactamase [Flavobacterium psychrophilum]AIG37908.1 beta-lactamase [Flavobacterium psychrophilum]AIG40179.1 beta-lactamase [Flavobacterium psychrophilum]